MAVEIPFVRDLEFEYGVPDQVSGKIRRVIARNPGPFTFYGTGTYVVGRGNVAVIDPGPELPEHFDALMSALDGESVTHIVITHTHADHSPLSRRLADATGGQICGFGDETATSNSAQGSASSMEEAVDRNLNLDLELSHGDVIHGDGWTLEAVHTPGHMANHMCFALPEEEALFSGDHVMGWSTSVVIPPEGSMTAYMDSLNMLLSRSFSTYWPTHGPPITDPKPHVEAYIAHRVERERQFLEWLGNRSGRISEMVADIYAEVPKELHPAAAQSVFAHLIKLAEEGSISSDGPPSLDSVFSAA